MSYSKSLIPGRIHPENPEEFKTKFIRQGHAYVRGRKPDGSFLMRRWKHVSLTQRSNLEWNLKTGILTPEYWGEKIVSVDIVIDPKDLSDH